MNIRPATPDDLAPLLELRNWYVENSFATFDEAPLTLAQISQWFSQFSPTGPHRLLVAEEQQGQLLGYCSSQPYRSHPAFAKTIETSIYIRAGAVRSGLGSALYTALFDEALADEDLHRAVVGIALPNEASVRLHQKFGFQPVGVFNEYACKRGQFISSQWMERRFST
ncbi:MAG: GNAT family N-acetyltransferase [Methylibium sp.]|nr:GNAT family N-acetyltransferase [Methylibium sp.]